MAPLLAQAQKYAALRKPYLINDMIMQDVLLDRRRVYATLKARRVFPPDRPRSPSCTVHCPMPLTSFPHAPCGMAG